MLWKVMLYSKCAGAFGHKHFSGYILRWPQTAYSVSRKINPRISSWVQRGQLPHLYFILCVTLLVPFLRVSLFQALLFMNTAHLAELWLEVLQPTVWVMPTCAQKSLGVYPLCWCYRVRTKQSCSAPNLQGLNNFKDVERLQPSTPHTHRN